MTTRTYIYSDVDMNLTKADDGDITRDIETDAVTNSLENILSTRPGSRRMIPEFAIDLQNLLFEPLDESNAKLMGDRILDAIKTWDDRVDIISVDIEVDFDNNLYKMRIEYTLRPSTEVTTVDFVLVAE